MPRSKGYKKQEALDGGYLNVRLSADLSAKLDRDCADYARRAGKPDASRVRGSSLAPTAKALQGWSDRLMEASLMLDRAAGER